ncbi:hypothetical protein ABZP36_000340 [Zizania latifolia]
MSSSEEEGGMMMLMSSRMIMSRDRSGVANASSRSFRVYYSLGAGTVPFVWESKPGTPKSAVVPAAAAADDGDAVPPISPPPSYQRYSSCSRPSRAKKCRRWRLPSSWASGGGHGGWMRSWVMSSIRRRLWPPPPSSAYRRRWLGQDSGVVGDVDLRRPPRLAGCFGAGNDHW